MKSLLEDVVEFYLEPTDFNGLPLRDATKEVLDEAAELVTAGLIEVISDVDSMNPHIRRWSSRRTREEQLLDIAESGDTGRVVCLYPTAAALADRLPADLYRDQPYRRRQAEGGGRLEVAYFRFDVLEPYRNDPRYHFDLTDFGVRSSVTDDTYEDAEEHEEDKTSISHVGFAYDLSKFDPEDANAPIIRRACAFLCDLGDLTPTHQQRWRTYEVSKVDGLEPHPVWWNAQAHGAWPDGLGPFERLLFELRTWNGFHNSIFGVDLVRTTERPREFGWILRPSQQEYDAFIHLLDKLLSENLRHEALDSAGIPKQDKNGQNLGTLSRLDRLLENNAVTRANRREILKPIRDVRSARQGPAHTLRSNVTDKTFVRKQVELLKEVTASLVALRGHWQSHPNNAGWSEPSYTAKHYWL
ncbi:hypothetical protein [Micromonospora sp. bgisy143]|uniref:hypothetical protein n=1 Tax=Micromonospora sp. bgisy143 TaxID=3413790 RepID=UPI003EB8E59A